MPLRSFLLALFNFYFTVFCINLLSNDLIILFFEINFLRTLGYKLKVCALFMLICEYHFIDIIKVFLSSVLIDYSIKK